MKREWLLLTSAVIITLVLSLGLIRWLAPQLLGIPSDLQMVSVSKKVPPFYEGIFRWEDVRSREFILKDPYTRVRAKPLFPEQWGMGPNDVLGFRNRYVPNIADIVVLGDSQTYGNNAVLENNWPSLMSQELAAKTPIVYAMATGGWGAVQYLYMFTNATLFKPRVIIVAFYSGNDALESFQLVYGADRWASLRPDPNIGKTDSPTGTFPPPESEWWRVRFKDGLATIFTPRHRLLSNQDHPAVKAGYAIMQEAARRMATMPGKGDINLVFAVIPTKELVYAEKVRRDGIEAPKDYLALVKAEKANVEKLAGALMNLPNAVYVDLVAPLQKAALSSEPLYPSNMNGHPIAAGYAIIAGALAPVVNQYLPQRPRGLVAVKVSPKDYQFVLVKKSGVWGFASKNTIKANGWTMIDVPVVSQRDISALPLRGVITSIEPRRFGPRSMDSN